MNYTPTWNPPDPPQEAETKQCPHCESEDTSFEFFADATHETEVWRCQHCGSQFTVEIEIPF